jgi:murein L,D-transpeptidase YcbB/YkuD
VRWVSLIAFPFFAAQALSLGAAGIAYAEEGAKSETPEVASPHVAPMAEPGTSASPSAQISSDEVATTTAPVVRVPETGVSETAVPAAGVPVSEVETVSAPAAPHPVVAIIRQKLSSSDIKKSAEADDVAALEAFYGARSEAPLWITEMGLSAKGQQALFEIEKADDWGLEAKAFALPEADGLPATAEAQALAEIKLSLAILKYARHARGGRHEPARISKLLDQKAPLRDPKMVIAEIGAAEAPDVYLTSLQPTHEQFVRLRQVLLDARADDGDGAKMDARDIKRILMNMERWRWMPTELGALHVWINVPEFKLYLLSNGEEIYVDRTLVGTIGYATPIFSADMKTIVFNPDWVAPPSVLQDKLRPALRRKYFNILKSNKLRVSYQGRTIDPTKVDWNRVNIHSYTFSQKAGPKNVLGKIKFLYPNKHIVYMHDTLDYRRKVFKEKNRSIGYGCVRMENPKRFAELLLAEDQDWQASKVQSLWDKSVNKGVSVSRKIPVHTTYFTAAVDKEGKVSTFTDLYGLDRKHAVALFGDAKGFPVPPPEPKRRSSSGSVASAPAGNAGGGGIYNSLGFIGN